MPTLEEILKERIADVDIEGLVKEEIREQIYGDIRREITKCISNKVDQMIQVEFEIQMKKPIKTDDGWGKKAEYESFEAFFRKCFKEKLDSTWDMQRKMESYVKEMVEKLFQKYQVEAVEKVANEMLKASGLNNK